MAQLKMFDLKSDLFATIFSFGAQGLMKLASSLVLTRILPPESYGIITILLSIAFVVEMLADINVTMFIVREQHGDQSRYLNSAWTLRLGRALINFTIVFACAPFISSYFYNLPELNLPLRVFSIWFVIAGMETMAFPLAIRNKRSRIVVYSELAASILATGFSLTYSYVFRDYWGMIFGTLLNRALITGFSYLFYRGLRPKIQIDLAAVREILKFTRFTMPSSLLTLALSQFDKIVFLKLFDLQRLGIYSLANNITSMIESVVTKISQLVLYPRCAHNFRENQATFSSKYYSENTKLFVIILFLPAAVGGAAKFVIALLYPNEYAFAGDLLQALMLRAALLSIASPSEDLLIAAGESQVILVGNILRATAILVISIVGYKLLGFIGFVYGIALSGLPPLAYYFWLQHLRGMLNIKYEALKVAFLFTVTSLAWLTSHLLLSHWHITRIRLH